MSHRLRNSLIGIAAGLGVAAVLVPSIAGGNARPDSGVERLFSTELRGSNEFPGPGDSDGTGSGTATIANGELCYDLAVGGIAPATLAHIHRGAAGVAGPIEIDLTAPSAGSSSGCLAIALTLADEIVADPAGFYFNVHNSEFPAGAVRGQLGLGPSSNSVYLLGEPLRAYDSRTAAGGAKCPPGQTRTISLETGRTGGGAVNLAVPAGSTAAQITLTVTETEDAGFLKVYSNAVAEPATSNINWSETGQNLAVATNVVVDAQSRIKVTCGFGATHFVVDVTGFYF